MSVSWGLCRYAHMDVHLPQVLAPTVPILFAGESGVKPSAVPLWHSLPHWMFIRSGSSQLLLLQLVWEHYGCLVFPGELFMFFFRFFVYVIDWLVFGFFHWPFGRLKGQHSYYWGPGLISGQGVILLLVVYLYYCTYINSYCGYFCFRVFLSAS